MDKQQFVYGLEVKDTAGVLKSFMFKCDAELDLTSRDELCTSMALLLGKKWSEINDSIFLYTNEDGSPCQQSDLYVAVGSDVSQAERMENLARLQDEAEEEAGGS